MFRHEVSQLAIYCGKCWSKTPCLRIRLGYPVIIVPPSSVRNYNTERNQATTQQTTNNHFIDERSTADLYMPRTIMPDTTWHMQTN